MELALLAESRLELREVAVQAVVPTQFHGERLSMTITAVVALGLVARMKVNLGRDDLLGVVDGRGAIEADAKVCLFGRGNVPSRSGRAPPVSTVMAWSFLL